MSLYDDLVGSVRPALLILLAAVAFVLLIACVNLSNLQLSRAIARIKEFALRSALGAARGRLVRQLLTESVLLAMAGGTAGFVLAIVGTSLLRYVMPANIPRIESMRVDTGVLLFTSALSIAAGLLFGVFPAMLGSRINLSEPLKQDSRKTTAAPQLKRWGNLLVVGQIALSIVLLVGAALFIKSYWKLVHVDTGLKSSGVFVSDLTWPTPDGNTVNGKQVTTMALQILEGAAKLPGVYSAALVRPLPVRSSGSRGDFEIQGRPLPADPHRNPNAWYRLATPDYFKVFGLPILRGLAFTRRDEQSQQQVAIVNQAFAGKFFPNGNAIGQRIRFFGFDRRPQFMTIVGIVPNVHAFGLNKPPDAEVFADYLQHTASSLDATLVVRGPAGDQPAIKSLIASIDPDTPVQFQRMDDIIGATISRERFQTFLLVLFAAFALLLSGAGIYGLLSYTVKQRTSELGIRMALGADRKAILALVLRQGGMLVAAGLALGMACALLLTRTLSDLLFAVQTTDPASFLAVAAAIAMLGCWLPARRAANIDPNVALRYD